MSKTTNMQGKAYSLFVNNEIVKRVQSLEWTADLATENIMELANAGFVERKEDAPRITISLDTYDVGSMALLQTMKTGNMLSGTGDYSVSRTNRIYNGIYSGNDVVTMNGTINDLDHIKQAEFIINLSENNTSTMYRTCHIQGAYVDSINFSYDIGGMAKETYNFTTDYMNWYLNASKDARVDVCAYLSASGATVSVDATGFTKQKVFVNREDKTSDATWTGTELAFAATVIAATDRIVLVYTKDTADAFPALTSTNTGARGGLRRGAIELYLQTHDGTATKMLRCQSVNGSLDLARQDINELGTQRYVDRAISYPLSVKVDATFNDSDLEAMAILQDATFASVTDMDVKNFADNSIVMIKIYKDEYTHDATTLAKTIIMSGMKCVNVSESASAGSALGQWRVSLTGDKVVWSGTGISLA